MAALLAGARLVLRQGVRYLPACTARAPAAPVRYLSRSPRCLTTAVQEKGPIDTESIPLADLRPPQPNGWSLHLLGSKLKTSGRITKLRLLKTFEEVCKAGKPSSSQAWFLLQSCGNSMPEVPLAERTEIANTIWNKLQELGVVLNESHYNTLLKIYLENEHKFSPTEFLASMEAAQVQPDQATYQELIAAYCNEGDIEGASTILGFMKNNNLPITEEVFNSLITGHARSGDMESAKNILSVMQGAGLAPGRGTHIALLCAYAEKGDIESIKQTLDSGEKNLTDREFLKIISALAKSGHSSLVPEIIEQMQDCKGYTQDVINHCLSLLTQGYGETAVQLAKKFIPVRQPIYDFSSQPGSFFLRHCVYLDMPSSEIKKYAAELMEADLHRSPLQFALYCALSSGKKELAVDLLKTLKEEGLPVRPHYCWPLLASFHKDRDLKGFFQVLQAIHEIDMELNLDTYTVYVADMFEDAEAAQAVLQEIGFQEDFNTLYLSALKRGIFNGNLKRVYSLLSTSNIPFVRDRSFTYSLMLGFARCKDADIMAKITKLLYPDLAGSQKPRADSETVGYFLYGLIDSMSDSEVQAREEHLKQYFHQLKEMGVRLGAKKVAAITQLLEPCNVPLLTEEVKSLAPSEMKVQTPENIPQLEQELETRRQNNQPFSGVLMNLLTAVVAAQDLDKALEIKSKYGDQFSFGMFMKVLGLCCFKNNPQEALKVKEEIKQKGFPDVPTTVKYIDLLKVLTANGLIEDAINILKEMQEKDVAVNDSTTRSYFYILNSLAIKGDVDSVNRLHEHMVMLGLTKPTANICSPLVMVHVVRNDFSGALDAMAQCHEKYKCSPLEHDLLLKLVDSGETDLLKKAVDHLSYAIGERLMLHDLLFAFIECGKYAEAQKIAETPGLRANPRKFNWFLERCRRANKVEMLEKCVEITSVLFDSDREELYFNLLKLYDKNNEWRKAIPLWHKMKEEGVTLQGRTVDLYVDMFKKSGEDVTAHIPEIMQEGARLSRGSLGDYSKKVVDLCENRNFNDAYSLFLDTEQKGISLTKTAYTRLIKGLLEAGLLEDVFKVENVAKTHFSNYSMKNVSCNLLLAEQVRRDCLKDALVTVERMLENGRMPSRVMLNRLTEAFAMRGDVESLEKMEKISESSSLSIPKMDRQFFNTKLLAHFKNDNFEEATSMIESYYTENDEAAHPLTYLLSKLMKNDMSEALEKVSIVAERLANQFSVYRPVTDLFLLYVQSGKEEEARHLLQRSNAILEQRGLLKVHIGRHIFRDQEEYVFRLLDLLSDPFYRQAAYGSLMKRYAYTQREEAASALYERMKAEQIEPDATSLKLLAGLLRKAGKPVPFLEPQESVETSSEEQSNASRAPEDKH